MNRSCNANMVTPAGEAGRTGMSEATGRSGKDLHRIDQNLVSVVPSELMVSYRFIPCRRDADSVVVAVSDPERFSEVVDELEIFFDMPVVVEVTGEQVMDELLRKLESSHSFLDSVSDNMRIAVVKETEKGEETLSIEKVSAEESPVVRLVDSTILDAINRKASDIHFESSDAGLSIRYRVDGMLLRATEPLDKQYQQQVISRIKVMSELDISERRIPQDGRFKLKIKDRYVDFRVSIVPTLFGEDAVIRILDRETLVPDSVEFRLENMKLPEGDLVRIRRMIHAPYGMFLVTGPTGSGKTTTLYTAISEVNDPSDKIITIEDPIEYQLKGIVQMQVNEKKGLTFAKGLRAILRHDPDKILVGEIRDQETAQIALQSALTGHLVFTTVHANSSFEVINRFIHMGVEPYNLIAALNCIVAQRLVRILCRCKVRVPPSGLEEYLRDSGLDYKSCGEGIFYDANPAGCNVCKGTGYSGRRAIVEFIEMNDDLREIFLEKVSISALKRAAKKNGTTFLREAALALVFAGETTIHEANRVTLVE